jgi:RND family efflux transporter MFP subunit
VTVGPIKNDLRFLAVLGLGVLGGVIYLSFRYLESNDGAETPVRIAQVRQVSLPATARLTGDLEPITKIDVVSRLAGEVLDVRFKPGDPVPAGAIVAMVRAGGLEQRVSEIETSIGAAQQALREREAELAAAEKHLVRDRDLVARDLIARRDGEQSEMAAETARASVELARAHLAQREAMLAQVRALKGLTRLTAPVAGEVESIAIKPGEKVVEGGAVLSIINLDALKLVGKINSNSSLRRGLKAQISAAALPGIIAEGHVARVEPEKSGAEKYDVEIQVDNRKRIFRSGIPAEARIELEAKDDSLLIPQTAVISESARHYVYKASGAKAVRLEVLLGLRHGEEVAVVEGLSPSDAIIVDWKRIKPGMRVRPAAEPAAR